ncbi:unnamed protein product, partial [Linum tenue]
EQQQLRIEPEEKCRKQLLQAEGVCNRGSLAQEKRRRFALIRKAALEQNGDVSSIEDSDGLIRCRPS